MSRGAGGSADPGVGVPQGCRELGPCVPVRERGRGRAPRPLLLSRPGSVSRAPVLGGPDPAPAAWSYRGAERTVSGGPARADGALPVAARAGVAAVHRRRRRFPGVRHGRLVRAHPGAVASGASEAGRRRGRRGVHAVRHGAGLRPRQAPHPDHRQRRGRAGLRSGGRLRAGTCPDPLSGGGNRPAAFRAAVRPGARRRVSLQYEPPGLRERRAPGEGLHHGRRHLPGRAVATLRDRGRQRSVQHLPRPALRQPVALHVLHPVGRRLDRGVVAGDARPGRGPTRRNAPDRRHPPARGHGRGGTRSWPTSCRPTRRSGPST